MKENNFYTALMRMCLSALYPRYKIIISSHDTAVYNNIKSNESCFIWHCLFYFFLLLFSSKIVLRSFWGMFCPLLFFGFGFGEKVFADIVFFLVFLIKCRYCSYLLLHNKREWEIVPNWFRSTSDIQLKKEAQRRERENRLNWSTQTKSSYKNPFFSFPW